MKNEYIILFNILFLWAFQALKIKKKQGKLFSNNKSSTNLLI